MVLVVQELRSMDKETIDNIADIIGTALAWFLSIAVIVIGGAFSLGVGYRILVCFGVL